MNAPEQRRLSVQQWEVSYIAHFQEPAFELLIRWVDLQRHGFSQLRRFGANLNDTKVESRSPNPGDASLAFWIYNYGAVVRFKLEYVEVWTNSPELKRNGEKLREIAAAALEVVGNVDRKIQIGVQRLVLSVHLNPGTQSVVETIAALAGPVGQGDGSLVPTGLSFARELPPSGEGSVIVERSARVKGGLFFKVTAEQPGSVPLAEFLQHTVAFAKQSVSDLRLDVEGL